MSSADDFELLRRWQAGEDLAGERLFRRHYQPLLRFFYNKARGQAHDLVQRAFLGCLEARQRIKHKNFRAFLYGVARNVLFDHYRLARREQGNVDFAVLSAEDLRPTPSSALARVREVELLLRGLRRIPLEGQILLELYYWEGMRAREIAEIVGRPEATVRTKIRRSRLRLEKEIATISATPALRTSTIEGMETWARRIREGVLKSPA